MSSSTAAVPRRMYSTGIRSFGAWTFDSSSRFGHAWLVPEHDYSVSSQAAQTPANVASRAALRYVAAALT